MLLLTFEAGPNRYAVDTRQVVEVVPRVGVRALPHAPAYLLGLLQYRGHVVPLVDFARLVAAEPARDALSTRVVVTTFTPSTGEVRHLGLVAGSVSQVVHARPDQVAFGNMGLDEAPYLGGVLQLDDGLVQVVKPERILPDRLQDALYGDTAESGP